MKRRIISILLCCVMMFSLCSQNVIAEGQGTTTCEHNFSSEIVNQNTLKQEGNCVSRAVYYYSCSICGEVERDDDHIFYGSLDSDNHKGPQEWLITDTEHIKICRRCMRSYNNGNSSNNDHDMNDGICTICGYKSQCVHANENHDEKCDYCGVLYIENPKFMMEYRSGDVLPIRYFWREEREGDWYECSIIDRKGNIIKIENGTLYDPSWGCGGANMLIPDNLEGDSYKIRVSLMRNDETEGVKEIWRSEVWVRINTVEIVALDKTAEFNTGMVYDVGELFYTHFELYDYATYSLVDGTGEGTLNGTNLTITKPGTFFVKASIPAVPEIGNDGGEATATLTVICEHKDDNKDHECDYGCSTVIGEHKDVNKDHKCDYGCSVAIGEHKDVNKDHKCDYGCSTAIGEHKDENSDHKCDYGCSVTIGEHKDINKDHVCDYGCSVTIGEHKDVNKDHKCDYGCTEAIGEHKDVNKDHKCDYGCTESIGEHKDINKDHKCDYGCTEAIGAHADVNKDHVCDYGCSTEIGEHKDENSDHKCDYGCSVTIGEHKDVNKDHKCDYGCTEAIGEHKDVNKDHKCDYGCTEAIGEHKDVNKDHKCDYGCSTAIGAHADVNKNHKCDICGETISQHSGGEATCTSKAVCKVCEEEYGEYDSTNHNLENIPEKAATVTETGNIEYWHCKDCDKFFADENGTKEIKLDDTITQKLSPEIIEGKGQNVTEGEKKELTFKSNAAFSDFIRVELDGETVDTENYTVEEGSTVVTLKADFVATLSVGEHTIGIVSESGTASAAFTVNENDNSPETGDNSNMALLFSLIFISGGLITFAVVCEKNKKHIKTGQK